MKTATLSADGNLKLDPFWAGVLDQTAGGDRGLDRDDEGPFDVAGLLDDCHGDADFCAMMLQKFASRAADQLAALERAASSRNAAELARQAHTLGEIAKNLSAGDLVVRAARLEWQAEAGALDHVGPLLAAVGDEVGRCLQAIPELLPTMGRQRRARHVAAARV